MDPVPAAPLGQGLRGAQTQPHLSTHMPTSPETPPQESLYAGQCNAVLTYTESALISRGWQSTAIPRRLSLSAFTAGLRCRGHRAIGRTVRCYVLTRY